MKVYPVKIEAVDDAGELLFTVEAFDQHTATIELKQSLYSERSLEDLFSGLRNAFSMLDLEK